MNTEEQNAAITAEGRIQVLAAAAGSGKTHTLVEKLGRDQARGIHPKLQVVVTFTNAAAKEFRDRIEKKGLEAPAFVGTLHAYALKWIAPILGDFRMIGDREFEAIIQDSLAAAGIKGISIRKAREFAAGDGTGLIGKNRSARAAIVSAMNKDRLVHAEMILGTFKKNFVRLDIPDHLHLYVDEFQDTAQVDAMIYRQFVDDAVATLFVVGDPRQAIFGFRGATSAEFLKLWNSADWRGQLSTNFRSVPSIIELSNRIAKRMTFPANFDLLANAARAEVHGPKAVNTEAAFVTCEQEAEAIAIHAISIKASEGDGALEDFAVLARYNASVEMIRDVLNAHGIATNCSLDRQEAVDFLDQDETVAGILRLSELPEDWEAYLIEADTPKKTRDVLKPILATVATLSDLPSALREGVFVRKENAVTVSTVHAAKGLEWSEVWLSGADSKSFDKEDSEDVRLAYVAATRAADSLIVTSAESRISFRRETSLTRSELFN